MRPAIEFGPAFEDENVRKTTQHSTSLAFCTLLPTFWAGMIVGVSFIATPAKFLAANLGTRAAFDVGRATFELFNSIEVGLAITLLAVVLYAQRRILTIILTVSLLAMTATQALVVLPVLSDRVSAIVAGFGVAPSYVHSLYVLMEIAKTGLLVALALRGHVAASAIRPASPMATGQHGGVKAATTLRM